MFHRITGNRFKKKRVNSLGEFETIVRTEGTSVVSIQVDCAAEYFEGRTATEAIGVYRCSLVYATRTTDGTSVTYHWPRLEREVTRSGLMELDERRDKIKTILYAEEEMLALQSRLEAFGIIVHLLDDEGRPMGHDGMAEIYAEAERLGVEI